MKNTTALALTIGTIVFGASQRSEESSDLGPAILAYELTVEPPAWLAGCWVQKSGQLTIEEVWMSPRGGVMLGMGRTSKGDVVVDFEHTRIYQRGDSLVYNAKPSGQPESEFVAPGIIGDAITFSNPTHDFPQRVIYRRISSDSLAARVEGTANGRSRGVDFGYRRTPCPGA